MRTKNYAIALAALVCLPSLATAQDQNRPTLADAVEQVRTLGIGTYAQRLLGGRYGGVPGTERAALADSMVAIAVSFGGDDDVAMKSAALAALNALGGGGGDEATLPFGLAFERIEQVFTESTDHGIRAAALVQLTRMPNKGRVSNFLSGVATSESPMAATAIEQLRDLMGSPGRARLRQLFDAGNVTEARAVRLLQGIARQAGWSGG